MARTKKKYPNGSPRGGIEGQKCVTAFGGAFNRNKSAKNYHKVASSASFKASK